MDFDKCIDRNSIYVDSRHSCNVSDKGILGLRIKHECKYIKLLVEQRNSDRDNAYHHCGCAYDRNSSGDVNNERFSIT